MTTIIENNGYKVTFNGSKTYFVTDSADQCLVATSSKVKAMNYFNKTVKFAGIK